MTFKMTRRQALGAITASPLILAALNAEALALELAAPEPFDFAALTARAKALAGEPYRPAAVPAAQTLDKIDFEQAIEINYRPEQTIWGDSETPIRLFHPHKFAKEPVRVFLVDQGAAREVIYTADLFTFGPKAAFAKTLPHDVGFAGFRILNPHKIGDWLAFQGASYFRSSGELEQYGLSARGIAIDTALPSPEEFPRFTEFFVERDGPAVNVYATLDGPSVTGAYRIHCRKEGIVTTEVEARLFARSDIKRLGIAPLTSMFWYSELNRAGAPDWRPEVHDSDGLALWTGNGERLWRPLNNPNRVMTSSFSDRAPKGFGLLQRDRSFADYEDDGVFYERRPSVWVEPLDDWGEGAVQLVEIPTDAEIHDNIVAYWVPAKPVRAGDALDYRYRVYWTKDAPFLPKIGQVVASRRGRGGRPAEVDKLGLIKYAVDFEGGELASFVSGDPIEPVVSVSRGEVLNAYALRVNTTDKWRVIFDLKADGPDPVEMRVYLRKKTGEPLTETWLAQHLPGVA
ncbi:MAG: glucan biosynthesis protein [Hyphomicrobiales bacterium]